MSCIDCIVETKIVGIAALRHVSGTQVLPIEELSQEPRSTCRRTTWSPLHLTLCRCPSKTGQGGTPSSQWRTCGPDLRGVRRKAAAGS